MAAARSATTLALLGFVVAGCGSAKPHRRDRQAARAAAICRRLDIQIGSLPTPIFTDSLDKAAGDYDVAASSLRAAGGSYRALAHRLAAVGEVAQEMSLAARDIAPGVFPRENRRMRLAQRALRREARTVAPACVQVGQEAGLLRLRVGPEPPVTSSPS
jgi:hypothetical protein